MQFSVVDFSNLTDETRPLASQAFNIWWDTYTEILAQCGETLLPEHFFRAKIMTVLHSDIKDPVSGRWSTRVDAFLLHNYYDLQCKGVEKLSYFDPVNDLIRQQLKNQRGKVFSCEFVTVHPDLRGKFGKMSIGDLMMGTAFKVFEASGCTHAMGFSRTDNGADRMAARFGFNKHDVQKLHGIDCGVMILKKGDLKDHPRTETQSRINELYEGRVDYIITKKEAA